MRILVWKIFISFWIVQALFFSMAAILYGTFRPQPPGVYAAKGLVAFCERNALQIYEQSGSAPLDAYLSDLQLSSGIQMFILDSNGNQLSTKPIPREERALLKRVLQSGKLEYLDGSPGLIMAEPVIRSVRDRYAAAVILPRGIPGPERSVGHLGTLDPMATGVLPLVLGRMTRLAQFYTGAEKSYQGEIRFGFATDTYDAAGVMVGPESAVELTLEDVRAAAGEFVGVIGQMPPPFSAKKIAGVPAYKLTIHGAADPWVDGTAYVATSDYHPLEILGRDGAGLVRHRQALLHQRHELLLAQALTPTRQRRAIERQLVAEAQLAAEVLVIGVLDPARAQHFVREVVHVLLYSAI